MNAGVMNCKYCILKFWIFLKGVIESLAREP